MEGNDVIRVFVSSVSNKFEPIRDQVLSDLRKSGYDAIGMEIFGAQSSPPIDVCLREVRKADVVALIIGPNYGSLLPNGISYTHAEFREARAQGIPVLAFRVKDRSDLSDDEKALLSEFVTDVGSVAKYDRLEPDESLDRLSAKILAALSSARERGELGSRYSLFQEYRRHFANEIGTTNPIFNHLGVFVGRDAERQGVIDFLRGSGPLLIVKAPGGSGKSRLLLEASKAIEAEVNAPKVFFVDAGAQWSPDDINRLPDTATVLIFDDAHRRPDLDRLIAQCRQKNDTIRCIVSCRPSAIDIVKSLVSQFATATTVPEIALPVLSKVDAEVLAKDGLGTRLQHLSDRLMRLADCNPLVIRVGARCIVENLVPPEILERTPEIFRSQVLDRLLDDPSLAQDSQTRRKLLEIIAAIGPVQVDRDDLLSCLSNLVGTQASEIRRLLAKLERSGFLLRRGRLLRVSPDILGDHLLYRAAVDENGTPTGFVEEMIEKFAPELLDNILANAAELDWRAAETATHESVLRTIWKDIQTQLPSATNSQRTQLVKQLTRAAQFAPAEVLKIAEWLTDNQDAPLDSRLVECGLDDTPDTLIDALIDTFAFIAGHPDFTLRCVRMLLDFAIIDEHSPEPVFGRRPRQKLNGLLRYEWRSNWRSPNSVHVTTIDVLAKHLLDPQRSDEAVWAIEVLSSVLSRIGEENEVTRKGFSTRDFSLAPYFNVIAERRKLIIDCFKEIGVGIRPAEAAAAIHELAKLLRPPLLRFGQSLDATEITAWQPEAESVANTIAEIAISAPTEAVRYVARREFRDFRQSDWPEIVPAVHAALTRCPRVPSEELYDVLMGAPWEERLQDFDDEERRFRNRCDHAAQSFWKQHATAKSVVQNFMIGVDSLRSISSRGDPHSGSLICAIVAAKPDEGEAVIREFIDMGVKRWQFIRPALIRLHDFRPETARRLVREFCDSPHEPLRASALEAAQFMIGNEPASTEVLELARRLSQDQSPVVRSVVPKILKRFRELPNNEAIHILTSIEWDGDLQLANAVLDAFHPRFGIDPKRLSINDIDVLLRRIEALPSLGGQKHDVLEFISFASTKRPRQTIEMLLNRIRSLSEHQATHRGNHSTPIPYNGYGLMLPGLPQSNEYHELLRRIRDTMESAGSMEQFWLTELFRVAVANFDDARGVLEEWVNSGDQRKIVYAAQLLRSFDHNLVFVAHEFVAEMLDAAKKCSAECLERIEFELSCLAGSGVVCSNPGEPAPRHLTDKEVAQKLAEQYSNRQTVAEFFSRLVTAAESRITHEMQRWDEEGDDE